jgi:large subunit ribosomal protein L28
MAQRCELCNKGPLSGNRVSHAHNVTHRVFNPNLVEVRAVLEGGVQKRVKVCTSCLRSGKITKPTRRKPTAATAPKARKAAPKSAAAKPTTTPAKPAA